jgi:hypothetical protein
VNKVACPTCESTTYSEGGSCTTLVGYGPHVIDGVRHEHNDNCVTSPATCSNGHYFVIRRRGKCPACDWVGREHCFCDTPLTVVV